MDTLGPRLAATLAAKSLLKHPFYQAWTAGTLQPAQLQEYARQYYHFEAAFPRFLSALHARTPSPAVRQLLLENLWDEEHGERNHVALWLDFAEAVGADRESVLASEPCHETAELVGHFRGACEGGPLAGALATLYAYEAQVPGVAREKIAGLRERYGFAPEQYAFFSVHLESDVAHSGAELQAIRELACDEEDLVAAASAACDRLWRFLDGCYATAA
jgi:pyrroloquinoline-quinone synthase